MSTHLPTVSPSRSLDNEGQSRVPGQKKSSNDQQSTGMTGPSSTTSSTKPSQPPAPTHRRFVLTDHVALRLFEDDPAITVLARRQQLEGYEIYLVEQWACSRDHPTYVITTYSGDPKDVAWGSILSLPTDESTWSPLVRAYFKAVDKCYARRTETKYGTLMVTNLGAFPSTLTVIPVPGGDARKHRELFFVNVNLKRLGCSGRLGIKLAPPNSATQAKFHQLYRTSDKVPLNSSVIELVRMCQLALVIFDKLKPVYADGLLCDHTEKTISDWWLDFGLEYYTVEPHDGILGPTTVAALLGTLMGARNRLSAHNAPIGKDVFDIESTRRAISYFQKTQRIQKTGLLDRRTYERLRRATAKAASREGWNMPKALKSTVAELGGKGGEMVMGMVGADKAGIADVETVDIDRFVEFVSGERAKWLWLGKPRKTNTVNMFSRLPDDAASTSEHENTTTRLLKREATHDEQKQRKRETEGDDVKKLQETVGSDIMDKDKDPYSKRAAIKRATEKIESNTGFHRIKDAVGRRTHHQHKTSKEDVGSGQSGHAGQPLHGRGPSETVGLLARRTKTVDPEFAKVLTETPQESATNLLDAGTDGAPRDIDISRSDPPADKQQEVESSESPPDDAEGSISSNLMQEIHTITTADNPSSPLPPSTSDPLSLRRAQTACPLPSYHAQVRNPGYYPRHLSFSIAEESVFRWQPLVSTSQTELEAEAKAEASFSPDLSLETKLASLEALSTTYLTLHSKLSSLSQIDTPWTLSTLSQVERVSAQAESDTAELEQMYLARFDEYQALQQDAREIVARDRQVLSEALRDLETLQAKLEYEVMGVRGKVEDAEDGIVELERQVGALEDQVGELERVRATEKGSGTRQGWGWRVVRMLWGV